VIELHREDMMTTKINEFHFVDLDKINEDSELCDEPCIFGSMVCAADIINCTSLAFLLVLMISAF